MPANATPSSTTAAAELRPALQTLAKRLTERKRARKGQIIFHLSADGDLHLNSDETSVSVKDGAPQQANGSRAELIGSARPQGHASRATTTPARGSSPAGSGSGAIFAT